MILNLLLMPCANLPARERIGVPFGIVALLVFPGAGMDAMIHPGRHLKPQLRGEMRQNLDEMGTQFVGLLFAGFSAWMRSELVPSVWRGCLGQ